MSERSIKSDLARLDRMQDVGIDYSDIPALDKSFLTKATAPWPPKEKTIRIDADISGLS